MIWPCCPGQYLAYVYKREHTDQEVADYLEIEKRAYRHNKKRALAIIEEHLDIIDQHEHLKTA